MMDFKAPTDRERLPSIALRDLDCLLCWSEWTTEVRMGNVGGFIAERSFHVPLRMMSNA